MAQDDLINKGTPLRIYVEEENYSGEKEVSIHMLIARENAPAEAVMVSAGLNLYQDADLIEVDSVDIGSDAYEAGFEAFQILSGVDVPNKQPSALFVYFPCVLLTIFLAFHQRRRKSLTA